MKIKQPEIEDLKKFRRLLVDLNSNYSADLVQWAIDQLEWRSTKMIENVEIECLCRFHDSKIYIEPECRFDDDHVGRWDGSCWIPMFEVDVIGWRPRPAVPEVCEGE